MPTIKAGRHKVRVPDADWWVYGFAERQHARAGRVHYLMRARQARRQALDELGYKAHRSGHAAAAESLIRKVRLLRVQEEALHSEYYRILNGALRFAKSQLPGLEHWDERHFAAAAELFPAGSFIAKLYITLKNWDDK